MKKFLLLLILSFGCAEKDSDILFSDELTVEGQIIEDRFAEIRLTNSLPFRGIIDSLEVAKSIETKAKVVLSNGETSEILTLKKDDSRFPFLYYRSNTIKGELGKEYNLSVNIRGKEFISKTTIPEKTKVLKMEFSEWIDDGVVKPEFKDIKLTIDNNSLHEKRYFKILIKNEKELRFELAKPFIFNTENIFTDTFPVVVSYLKFNEDGEKENQIKVNEVIELKFIAITKEQFDFWKSVEGDETTPLENSTFTNQVISNISNGAFGYWSGESIETFKFKIP